MEVDRNDLIERLLGHVGEHLPMGDAGVGAEDVQRAQASHRLGHQPLAFGRVRDAGGDERPAAPEALDLGDADSRLVLVRDVVDRDVGAATGQRERDPAADRAVARGAGDQRDLAVELVQAVQITTSRSPSRTRTS